ncbi:hypothetical protein LTR97_005287 [Elasticomyces elasticus]|uniref:Uncharacterized protein n=1 Tax=Elasticomyces elasticus TaxID=574655 RepID=A0AAN8A2T1_9PEZI|nr:hypothetical protein LTR97_005287 [Elasticomyces elasticus]
MSTFSAALAEAATKNGELLSTLAQTDHAPPALKQNKAYISDLQTQLGALDQELKKLHAITEDERKDHLKYHDSTMKRLAHKLGGKRGTEKFVSKQEKEEREFLEAWQHEREAIGQREELARALRYAQDEKRTLEDDCTRHIQAQIDLDKLYNAIFSGPTPDVPGEDQMESTVATCRDWYQQCQAHQNAEKQAMDGVTKADMFMSTALNDMNDALRTSTADMWGGGTMVDYLERRVTLDYRFIRPWTDYGQRCFTRAVAHMNEAIRAQPAIHPLSPVNIDQDHFISDVLFDNIFTDMAQHDRIQNSSLQLQQSARELKQQLPGQQQRVGDAGVQLKQASQNLEEARLELQRIRAEAFMRLGSGQTPWQADTNSNQGPPSYAA